MRASRAAPWLLWLAGLAAAFYPALASGFGELQIRLGDPRLVQFILEHTWRWVSEGAALWSPPVYWPATGVSAMSDVMLAAGPLYWLPRALGAGPGPAMQVWMMACLSLNFLAMWTLLRKVLGVSIRPAAVGAALYGFGSQRLANFNSPQLFPLFYGTFALTCLARLLESDRAGHAGRARLWLFAGSALGVLQAWSTFYPSFFLALLLLVATGVALASARGRGALVHLVRGQATSLFVAGATRPRSRACARSATGSRPRSRTTTASCTPSTGTSAASSMRWTSSRWRTTRSWSTPATTG